VIELVLNAAEHVMDYRSYRSYGMAG
jgi:hypothetical protein